MKGKAKMIAMRSAAGALLLGAMCGCGSNKERSPLDEGLAAEALGNWEKAWEKYLAAEQEGNGEGSRRLAEWLMIRGEEEVFARNPRDSAWLDAAKEWRRHMEAFGREAEAKGYAVDGLPAALERYDAEIAETAEHIQREEEEAARNAMEAKKREEETSALEGLRLRRSGLVQQEMRLESTLRETWEQYDQSGEEWLKDLLELVQEEATKYNSAFSSHKTRIDDRYKRLRDPLEKEMEELRKELADAEAELQECSRKLAERERKTIPASEAGKQWRAALQKRQADEIKAKEVEQAKKQAPRERAAMWDGW